MRRLVISGLVVLELLLFVAIVKTSVLAIFPNRVMATSAIELSVPGGRIAYRLCLFCTGQEIGGAPFSGPHKILLIAPMQNSS